MHDRLKKEKRKSNSVHVQSEGRIAIFRSNQVINAKTYRYFIIVNNGIIVNLTQETMHAIIFSLLSLVLLIKKRNYIFSISF